MDLVTQLNHIFYPQAIAVIGATATPEKLGFLYVKNLLDIGFKGKIYPVNPGLTELFGLKVYSSVETISGEVDLAIIVIPAQHVISVLEECVARKVKGVVITSGGFKEVGTNLGQDLQTKVKEIARKGGVRIIGPNTLGVINYSIKMNATFQPTLNQGKAGGVGVVTQSGGVCAYIVHALTRQNVGISKALGLGNRSDLDFDEVVAYLGEDKETRVITIYIEGLEQPRQLMNTARQVVKRKPIVAYKGGRGEGMKQATLSHTGALAGKYELYKAAFAQAGIISVNDMSELASIVKALDSQRPSSGDRVAIFSVQAGPGITMADKCHELGLRLAELSPTTKRRLRELISPLNSVDNPVDVGWASNDFDTSLGILKVVLEDSGVDAVTLATVYHPGNVQVVRAIASLAKNSTKSLTVCFDAPGGVGLDELKALEASHVPTYSLPEEAVIGLAGLVRYGRILKTIS